MNAHKFVAEKGIGEAKRVLSGAPDGSAYYWEIPRSENGVYSSSEANKGRAIILQELKQVVESVELLNSVEVLGRTGYQEVKSHLEHCDPKWCHFHYKKWKKAITDYELVESYKQVKFEVLDMVDVSPRCEVRNG